MRTLLFYLFVPLFLVFWQIVLFIHYSFNPKEEVVRHYGRIIGRSFNWICGVKVVIKGLEKLNPDKNYIYIANHQSIFDIFSWGAVFPYQYKWMAKKELLKIPLISWGLNRGYGITFDRSNLEEAKKSVSAALEELQKGSSIFFFPEGTRSEDGEIQPFKRGAFLLACRAKVPLVPVVIEGSNKIKPKKGFFVHPGTITISLLDPVTITDENTINQTTKKLRDLMIKTLS